MTEQRGGDDMNDIFIRYIDMPDHTHGFVMEDPDGNYNAYLNPKDDDEVQRKTLNHEMLHVRRRHLKDYTKTVRQCEEEADGEGKET